MIQLKTEVMRNKKTIVTLLSMFMLLPTAVLADSSLLLSIPPIIARAGDGKPEAFIELADVKDGAITLKGYFKDKENDPLVSASWVVKSDKGIILYEFSGLEVTNAAMAAKGDITIVFTVTTGTGSDLKTSEPAVVKKTV